MGSEGMLYVPKHMRKELERIMNERQCSRREAWHVMTENNRIGQQVRTQINNNVVLGDFRKKRGRKSIFLQ